MVEPVFKQYGPVVRDFLERPHDKSCFDRFYLACYNHTAGYLRRRLALGYSLPTDQFAGDGPTRDLTIDVLGFLLESKAGRSFYRILDHFASAFDQPYSEVSDEELYASFRSLVYGQARQNLSRIQKESDPQIADLKRRFKDIMRDGDYTILRSGDASGDLVHASTAADNLRLDRQILSFDELIQLVEQSYLESHSRTEWCRHIFVHLNDLDDRRNAIRKHELLSAVVAVNLRHHDLEGLRPTPLPKADFQLVISALDEAKAATLAWLETGLLPEFVSKNRIRNEEADQLKLVFEMYITDLAHVGDTDKLPVYFKEVHPEVGPEEYLKRYKYVVDTVVSKGTEYFEELVKKKPTLQKFRDYF